MKRTFLAKRNALLTSASFSWGGAALAVAVLVLLVRLLLPNLFWSAMAPVFSLGNGLASSSHAFFAGFENASALALKNEQLESENAALASENHALTENAAAAAELSGSGIVAGVVSRPPESPYDTLVVAGGSKRGVLAGMEAFGPGGVPVGVVTDILADFSRVTLFSSPNVSVQAWVGAKKIPLALSGAGAGAFRASLARTAGVNAGDEVFLAAGGALPIGTVTNVDTDPSSPVVVLAIQGAVNLFSLTAVELRPTGPAFVNSLTWTAAQSK